MSRSEPSGVSGIVLAGGGSSRFGRDKLSEPVDGVPLLNRSILGLSSVCDDVVVVLAPDDDREALPPGVRVVHDRVRGDGPLAGLQEGLLSVVRADVALACGGDMPSLQEPVLRAMLAAIVESAWVSAVALGGPAGPLPLPMAIRTWPAAEATHTLLHAGARALKDLLEALGPVVIPERDWRQLDPEGLTIVDVDEPADLP
jgi:molybdopterin-guanine dinucleotide biosynthesis protein A